MRRKRRSCLILGTVLAALTVAGSLTGCRAVPIVGNIRPTRTCRPDFRGTVDVHLPPAPDPGPVVPVVVRRAGGPAGAPGGGARRGRAAPQPEPDRALLGRREPGGRLPREARRAAADDPRVRAVVVRINSPGGGVAASDLMAEELQPLPGRPRQTGRRLPARRRDRRRLLPCRRLRPGHRPADDHHRGVGAIVNHANLQDAMAAAERPGRADQGGRAGRTWVRSPPPCPRPGASSRRWPTASATGSPPGSRSVAPR